MILKVVISYLIIGVCMTAAYRGILEGALLNSLKDHGASNLPKIIKAIIYLACYVAMALLWILPAFQLIFTNLKKALNKVNK
jgi:hypothetical protein